MRFGTSRDSRCVPHGLLEFRPGQEVTQARLQKIGPGLVAGGSGLSSFGRQYDSFGQLILRQPFALLP